MPSCQKRNYSIKEANKCLREEMHERCGTAGLRSPRTVSFIVRAEGQLLVGRRERHIHRDTRRASALRDLRPSF